MRILCSWYHIYNPKNQLFWNNESGWGSCKSADSFSLENKAQMNLPIDGILVPHVSRSLTTVDELVTVLNEFPKETPIYGITNIATAASTGNIKVFSNSRNIKMREESDEDGTLFADVVFMA